MGGGYDTGSSQAELLSSLGAEKRVPIRFVNLLAQAPSGACPSADLYAGIQRQITNANRVFKVAGLQFYVSSVECFVAPTFAEFTADTVPWSTAYAELGGAGKPLPNMESDAWDAIAWKTKEDWLSATATYYVHPDNVLVWIQQKCCTSFANRPESGRGFMMYEQPLRNANDPFKFAHELGHYFGLAHPWHLEQPTQGTGYLDPETGVQQTLADWWDLVYKPAATQGAPHQFFTSRSAAAQHTTSLQEILPDDGGPQSCAQSGTPPSWLTCQVGPDASSKQTYDSGDPELRGLSFIDPDTGGYSMNLMSYYLDGTNHHFLSAAQVLLLRKYLRWDVNLVKGEYSDHRKAAYGLDGKGGRARHGSWVTPDPLAKLDFNGDGLRDLAVWIPPMGATSAGRLRVLLSPGFTQQIDTQFGRIGDVPMVARFDSDACTDFGVYQPGGGVARNDPPNTNAYWRWCPTSCAAPASTSCGSISQTTCPGSTCTQFGARDYVPVPGLEMTGSAPNEPAVFIPPLAWWAWLQNGTQFRAVGDPLLGRGELMPGLYDGDALSDLVVYYRSNATYYYARSEQGWSPAGSKAMGSQFAPWPTGTSSQRAGAIPVPFFGMQFVNIAPGVWVPAKRRRFSLFWPQDGSWNTVWEPFGAATLESCIYGMDRADQPFTGFDRDGDFRADWGIFRDSAAGGSSTIFTRTTVPGSCTGGVAQQLSCSTCDVRTRVVPVADMTGDGREELLLVHPDSMKLEWRVSEHAYGTTGSGTWLLNDPLAVLL